jgi:hypothetical protein
VASLTISNGYILITHKCYCPALVWSCTGSLVLEDPANLALLILREQTIIFIQDQLYTELQVNIEYY